MKEKNLDLKGDSGMITPFLASSLINRFKPENKSQFKFIKDQKSLRMKDFFIKTSIPVTLYCKMITFRDRDNSLKPDGDLLKTETNNNFNAGHFNPQDLKLLYELGKK